MKYFLLTATIFTALYLPGRVLAQNTFPASGSVGIGTTSPQVLLHVEGSSLGSTSGNRSLNSQFRTLVGGNTSILSIYKYRHSTGSDWLSTATRIQQVVDNTEMGFLEFNPTGQAGGLALGTANQSRLVVDATGRVGIGLNLPQVPFEVVGESRFHDKAWFGRNNDGSAATILRLGRLFNEDSPVSEISTQDLGGEGITSFVGTRWGQHFSFQRRSASGTRNLVQFGGTGTEHYFSLFATDGTTEKIKFRPEGISYVNGQLAIGTDNPKQFMLAVKGDAVFAKVMVRSFGAWPDYVFQPGYRLPPLSEVEAFIRKNSHLPGVPSAKEVETDGLDLGETQAALLKKIEELTLYVLQLNKALQAQQEEILKLKETKAASEKN